MDVISQMLGVPVADRPVLRRLSDLLVHREEGVTDVPPAGVEAAFELVVYYAEMIADRRASPGDDLVSALCAAEVDGDRLSDDEITAFLFLMVVAGNETTTKLLAHAWYWAWVQPRRAGQGASPTRAGSRTGSRRRCATTPRARCSPGSPTTDVDAPRRPRSPPATGSCCSPGRPTAIPGVRRRRTATTSTATRPGSPASASAATSASARRWPASRPGSCSRSWWRRVADYDIDAAGTRRVHSVNVRGFETLPDHGRCRR